MRREALTDDLTGIANRRALPADLERRRADDQPFGSALLDRSTEVDDGLGHAAGDELLRQVVHQLVQAAPDPVLVTRLGGDGIALLIPEADQVTAVADAIALHTATVRSYDLLGHRVHVAAGTGVASFPQDARRPSDLLRCADVAVPGAKTPGGRVCAFGSGGPDGIARRRGSLRVLFQPQLDVADGSVVGAEALVPRDHPDLGLLSPVEFLEEAERHGLTGHLTHRDCPWPPTRPRRTCSTSTCRSAWRNSSPGTTWNPRAWASRSPRRSS